MMMMMMLVFGKMNRTLFGKVQKKNLFKFYKFVEVCKNSVVWIRIFSFNNKNINVANISATDRFSGSNYKNPTS
jgi:hypothetical protein